MRYLINRGHIRCAAIVLALLFATVPGFAQKPEFKWEDVLCSYTGTFDERRYSLSEIRDTYRLVELAGLPLEFRATVWKFEDIERLDAAELEREYKERRNALLALRPVKLPFWERAREARLTELEQFYRLSLATVKGYREPTSLREYAAPEQCKLKYADPIIAGGDKLVDAWRQVNRDSQAKNSEPARLQRQWEDQNASPDRLKFALVETMAFGWWNCANESIQYVPSDGAWEREFKKLFVRVRGRCDEP